jgi:hypothetical protein
MSPITDATPSIYALDHMLSVPFAEVRPATDLVKDPWGLFIEVLASAQKPKSASTAAAEHHGAMKASIALEAEPPLGNMSPWLIDAMTIIDAHRKSIVGSQSERTVRLLLDSAEMLASFIAEVTPRRRPQVNIEPSGRPTFGTATEDFYINLTVDEPNRLTWYAVVGETEHFNEGVAFDGRKLPAGLAHLFSM